MYALTENGMLRCGDIFIPASAENTEYRAYLRWVAEGNTPTPYTPPPPPPVTVVSMRQARLALLGAGMLTAVDQAVAGMTGVEGQAAQIEWQYATTVDRNHAFVAQMAAALSLTSDQLDALFIAAAAIP